ncbi:MAG: hypothetical protein K2H88_03435 [Duncaniella sp.]|nr:hypothetical protein [Duncaniella sp.]
MDRPLKILLLGDASNFHRTLSTGLRRLGHDVTVASEGGRWMKTERDIDTSRPPLPGKLGGLALWLRLQAGLKRRFTGYDVVSIHSPGFLSLKPQRITSIYDYLLTRNRGVFHSMLGTTPSYVRECISASTSLPYNEFRINGRPSPYSLGHPGIEQEWMSPALTALEDRINATILGSVTALYEYDLTQHTVLPQSHISYGGIPIDTTEITPMDLPDRIDRVRIFLGRHRGRLLEKGTDILEAAARDVVERHPSKAELVIVENRPYAEYLSLLRSAHIVLDQLYSYSPATNALLAMAMGLNTVSGGDEAFYGFIGEKEMRPVLHVEPDFEDTRRVLENAVLSPHLIRERGKEGRRFVEKHNDCEVVARRNVDYWIRRLGEEGRL